MKNLNSNVFSYIRLRDCIVTIVSLFFFACNLFAINSSGVTISGGSVKTNSNHFYLKGTVGQTPISATGGNILDINSGLWQIYMTLEEGQCHPGDADNDGLYNILDVVYLINYRYKGGPSPVPDEFCSGDPNCDCSVDILDIVYLINFIYKEPSSTCKPRTT